jgi:dihydrofolate reductase
MRKLTAGLFMSVDGVVEAPNHWQFDSFDDELGRLLGDTMAHVDTGVLGRVGYEEWSAHWPAAGGDNLFAAFINGLPKYVASTTLRGDLGWNATLIDGDVEAFLTELKRSEGGEISLFAGISLVQRLLSAGILDELTLMIHPVVAGAGRRLFEHDDAPSLLELVRSSITSKGNAVLTYAPRAG